MNKLNIIKRFPYILLIPVLVFAFIIRVYNLNFNSPFLDEALYIIRGLNTLSGNVGETLGDISWVGGNPFFYPLLSGIFYSIGGIVGTRLFNVVLGTVSVFLIYLFTKQLLLFKDNRLNEIAGIAAACLMATTTVAITASRLAIYDAFSFTLFLLGLVTLHKAIYSGERKYYLQASIILFLSFLAKYITAIFFPFILALPYYLAWRMKNKKIISGVLNNLFFPLAFLMALYVFYNFSSLQSFFFNNAVSDKSPYTEVIRIFWKYSAPIYALFVLGAVVLWKSRKPLIVLLFGLSLIPLLTHAISGNANSIQQHTFLSVIFLFPVAGALLAYLTQQKRILGILAILIVMGINLYYALPQVRQAETFWPNSSQAIALLENEISSHEKILAEGGDIVSLGLEGKVSSEQVEGPFSFSYAGKEGIEAYTQALDDGYFHLVQLEGTYFSSEDIATIEEMLAEKYKKVYDDGKQKVYHLTHDEHAMHSSNNI